MEEVTQTAPVTTAVGSEITPPAESAPPQPPAQTPPDPTERPATETTAAADVTTVPLTAFVAVPILDSPYAGVEGGGVKIVEVPDSEVDGILDRPRNADGERPRLATDEEIAAAKEELRRRRAAAAK